MLFDNLTILSRGSVDKIQTTFTHNFLISKVSITSNLFSLFDKHLILAITSTRRSKLPPFTYLFLSQVTITNTDTSSLNNLFFLFRNTTEFNLSIAPSHLKYCYWLLDGNTHACNLRVQPRDLPNLKTRHMLSFDNGMVACTQMYNLKIVIGIYSFFVSNSFFAFLGFLTKTQTVFLLQIPLQHFFRLA